MRDPYTVLGVAKNADADNIKKAYRRLARENHPDRHPGDKKAEDRFKEISHAYGILSDAEQRRAFDTGEIDANGNQQRPKGFGGGAGGGAGGAGFGGFGGGFGGRNPFEDFFNQGQRQQRRGPIRQRGSNVAYSLTVEFKEAAQGLTKAVKIANGKALNVKVPAGTQDGQTLRLKGQGMAGVGGAEAGDALVEIKVRPDAQFKQDGNTITVEVPITLPEAVLGAKIEVPTVSGSVTLKVPEGTNTDTKMRLKGKGIKGGDQFVIFKIVLPKTPDKDLIDFAKTWSTKMPYTVRPSKTKT